MVNEISILSLLSLVNFVRVLKGIVVSLKPRMRLDQTSLDWFSAASGESKAREAT